MINQYLEENLNINDFVKQFKIWKSRFYHVGEKSYSETEREFQVDMQNTDYYFQQREKGFSLQNRLGLLF
jgi:hypothetical protein